MIGTLSTAAPGILILRRKWPGPIQNLAKSPTPGPRRFPGWHGPPAACRLLAKAPRGARRPQRAPRTAEVRDWPPVPSGSLPWLRSDKLPKSWASALNAAPWRWSPPLYGGPRSLPGARRQTTLLVRQPEQQAFPLLESRRDSRVPDSADTTRETARLSGNSDRYGPTLRRGQLGRRRLPICASPRLRPGSLSSETRTRRQW